MPRRPGRVSGSVWLVLAALWGALVFGGCQGKEQRVRVGQRLYEQARFQDAEEQLAPLFEAEPPSADSVHLLYGKVLLAHGELPRARAIYRAVLDSSSRYRQAALHGLAQTQFFLGHPDTAQARSRHLLKIAREQRDTLYMAKARHVLGRVHFYEAAYDEALKHQRRSLRWARRMGSRKARADALRQIGVLHWYRGRLDSARAAFYEPALRLYRQVGDSAGVATTLSNIGLLHWQKNQTLKNARYQLKAFAMRKRMGDQIGLADSYAFLAQVPRQIRSRNTTFQSTYLRKSLALSRRIGYAWGEQVAAKRLRNYLRNALGDLDRTLIPLGDSTFQRSGEDQFLDQVRAAHVARQQKAWRRADSLYAKARRLADSLGYYNFQRATLVNRSRILLRREKWAEAEKLLREAEALGADGARFWTQDFARESRARIALHRGDSTQAEALLRPLVAELDRRYLEALHETAPDVAFETAAGTVHGRRARMYGRLLGTLVGRRPKQAFAVLERERALPFWGGAKGGAEERETFNRFVRRLERLETDPGRESEVRKVLTALGEFRQKRLAEQRVLDRTGPTEAALDVTSRRALPRALRQDEVFVEYFIRKEQHYVFVARRDSSRFLPVSMPRSEIANTIDVFRSSLRRGNDHPNEQLWHASGRRLFKELVRPLLDRGWIQSGNHLLIAPHRRLWGIPFQGLPLRRTDEETRFLIEQNVVSYVPSATDLVEQRTRSPHPLRSVLAVAPKTEALPQTAQEVEAIQTVPFGREQALINEAAHADRVREGWTGVDVVHLAAHARTNTHFPLYSQLSLNRGAIELYEVLQDSVQAQLVVLSACETGQVVGSGGREPTSASLVSFPRAFLSAGAASVIGSLWRVEDAATATLMQDFYRELAATRRFSTQTDSASSRALPSLAHVLARAQRAYLDGARQAERPAHPFYWAGFYLMGDAR